MEMAAWNESQSISTGRRIAFTSIAILFALLLAIGLEGWTLLIKTWFVDEEDQNHRVHHLAWASLGAIIIVGGVLA
jgi:hypothetical protein